MPRAKNVRALKTLCLRNIAVNMDGLWVPLGNGCPEVSNNQESHIPEYYSSPMTSVPDQAGQSGQSGQSGQQQSDKDSCKVLCLCKDENEDIIYGPFSDLTGDLVRDLMKTVREMGLMKKHYLGMFLLPQLQQLDLSLYETNDPVLRAIGDRCKNLKKLYLCWNAAVGASELKYIICEATKLTHLNVAGTKCDDHVVDAISRHCVELRDLDISDCNVTNKGVLYLCGGHKPDNHRLKHLVRLNLTGTKVDNQGVRLVLKKMRSIRYLEHEWLWDILYDMHTPFEPEPPVEDKQKLALMKVNFLGSLYTPVVNKAVDVLGAFCPYLTEVSIFGCGFDDQAMFKLAKLSNLKVFCLDGGRNMVTFRWGLLPFLHERGATLKEMSLTQITNLNIVEVSTYCINLEVLCLIDVSTTVVNQVQPKEFLRELKQLEIRQHMRDLFGEDVLKFILKNCHNVLQVNLFSITFISNAILSEVMNSNPLEKLEKITFDRSMGYTSDMIIKLIGHCRSLQCCHVADTAVRDALLEHVQSNNYDLMV